MNPLFNTTNLNSSLARTQNSELAPDKQEESPSIIPYMPTFRQLPGDGTLPGSRSCQMKPESLNSHLLENLQQLKREAHRFQPPPPENEEHNIIAPERLKQSEQLHQNTNTKLILKDIIEDEEWNSVKESIKLNPTSKVKYEKHMNFQGNVLANIEAEMDKGKFPDSATSQVIENKAKAMQRNLCGLATAGSKENFHLMATDIHGNETDLTEILNYRNVRYVTKFEGKIASIYTDSGRVRFNHDGNISYTSHTKKDANYFPNDCASKYEVFYDNNNNEHNAFIKTITNKLQQFKNSPLLSESTREEVIDKFEDLMTEFIDDSQELEKNGTGICFNSPQAELNNNSHIEFGLLLHESSESKDFSFDIVRHPSRGQGCMINKDEYRAALKELMLEICPHVGKDVDVNQLEMDRQLYIEKLLVAPRKNDSVNHEPQGSSESEEVEERSHPNSKVKLE